MMKIRDFAAGSHHAAMVDELGRVFTWGAGSYGRYVPPIPVCSPDWALCWRMKIEDASVDCMQIKRQPLS